MMTPEGFIALLIIAAICGAIAEAIVGYSAGGLIFSTAVGLGGAYLGTALADYFRWPSLIRWHLPGTAQVFDLGWTVIGAIAVLFLVGLVRGRRGE